MYYVGTIPCGSMNELRHFGIPGMKWGQRRWQNEDGTFNEAGKARYGFGNGDGRGSGGNAGRLKRLAKTAGVAALGGASLLARRQSRKFDRLAFDTSSTARAEQSVVSSIIRDRRNKLDHGTKLNPRVDYAIDKDIERWSQSAMHHAAEGERYAAKSRAWGTAAKVAAGAAAVGVGAYAANKIWKAHKAKKAAQQANNTKKRR